MKTFRKVLSILMVLAICMAISVTAFADDGTTEKNAVDVSTHTFTAYQIFSGTQGVDAEGNTVKELGNITWGDGINSTGFMTALVADETIGSLFTADMTAAQVAEVISEFTTAQAKVLAKIAAANVTGDGVAVKDGDKLTTPGYYIIIDTTDSLTQPDAYNLSLLQVTNPVTIASKNDYPSSYKKVMDDEADSEWSDTADYALGDDVPFEINGTIPQAYDDYDTYKYIIHDEMSAGLTLNEGSVTVKVDGTAITEGYELKTTCTDDCTFEIVFANTKTVSAIKAGSKITVNYTAKLNENAVVGKEGNPNKSYLEFTNKPDTIGDGSTGTTPPDIVIVFTYDLVVNKVDEDGAALEGAGFTLYIQDDTGAYTAVGEELKGEALTTFTWSKLDEGTYKLSETTTPAGYNTAEDIYFTVTAVTKDGDTPSLESLTVTEIDADGKEIEKAEGEEAAFTVTLDSGKIETNVVNNSGAVLPTTGGIGTTLFYIIGGILVLSAGVIIVVRRKTEVR